MNVSLSLDRGPQVRPELKDSLVNQDFLCVSLRLHRKKCFYNCDVKVCVGLRRHYVFAFLELEERSDM